MVEDCNTETSVTLEQGGDVQTAKQFYLPHFTLSSHPFFKNKKTNPKPLYRCWHPFSLFTVHLTVPPVGNMFLVLHGQYLPSDLHHGRWKEEDVWMK